MRAYFEVEKGNKFIREFITCNICNNIILIKRIPISGNDEERALALKNPMLYIHKYKEEHPEELKLSNPFEKELIKMECSHTQMNFHEHICTDCMNKQPKKVIEHLLSYRAALKEGIVLRTESENYNDIQTTYGINESGEKPWEIC